MVDAGNKKVLFYFSSLKNFLEARFYNWMPWKINKKYAKEHVKSNTKLNFHYQIADLHFKYPRINIYEKRLYLISTVVYSTQRKTQWNF